MSWYKLHLFGIRSALSGSAAYYFDNNAKLRQGDEAIRGDQVNPAVEYYFTRCFVRSDPGWQTLDYDELRIEKEPRSLSTPNIVPDDASKMIDWS